MVGGALMRSVKKLPMPAAIGAGARLAENLATDNIAFVRENWYGAPAAHAALAVLVGTRPRLEAAACGLAAIAGYKAVENWELKEFQEGKREKSPVPMFAQAGGETQGFRDTGYLLEPGDDTTTLDTGALIDPAADLN